MNFFPKPSYNASIDDFDNKKVVIFSMISLPMLKLNCIRQEIAEDTMEKRLGEMMMNVSGTAYVVVASDAFGYDIWNKTFKTRVEAERYERDCQSEGLKACVVKHGGKHNG